MMTVSVIILSVIFYGMAAGGAIIEARGRWRKLHERKLALNPEPAELHTNERSPDVVVDAVGADAANDPADKTEVVPEPIVDTSGPVADPPAPPPTVAATRRAPLFASRVTHRRYWH
jgi:hypothetical protein